MNTNSPMETRKMTKAMISRLAAQLDPTKAKTGEWSWRTARPWASKAYHPPSRRDFLRCRKQAQRLGFTVVVDGTGDPAFDVFRLYGENVNLDMEDLAVLPGHHAKSSRINTSVANLIQVAFDAGMCRAKRRMRKALGIQSDADKFHANLHSGDDDESEGG